MGAKGREPALQAIKQLLVTHCTVGRVSYDKKIMRPGPQTGQNGQRYELFYILSGPLGYVMEWIYKLLPSYGWDIILFTLLINIVKIPLQTSQQKSMAKMSASSP